MLHTIFRKYNKRDFILKVLLIFNLFFISCNVNKVYENRESDRDDAENITKSFYNLMENGEYKNSYALFTKRFFLITDTSKLLALYTQIDNSCGTVSNYSLLNWKTTVVKGAIDSGEYVFLYDVIRKKCKTKETITMKKESEKIRIISYDVNAY